MDITKNELEKAIQYVINVAKNYDQNCTLIARSKDNINVQPILYYYFTSIAPQYIAPWKYNFKREFSLKELIWIFKGTVINEGGLRGHLAGSVSATDKIYGVIAEKNYAITKVLQQWLDDIGAGKYFRRNLVDDLSEARLASMFSEYSKEKE